MARRNPSAAVARTGLRAPGQCAILDERFRRKGLPDGWYTDTPRPRYGGGAWECRPGDGVFIPLPHDAWRRLRVEIELDEIGPNANAFCGLDNRSALSVALGGAPATRHQATDGGRILAEGAARVVPGRGRVRVTCEWTAATMCARVDGVTVLRAPNLRRRAAAGALQMGFRDCRVRRIAAFGMPLARIPAPPRPLGAEFPLEVTVDFNDDLMACAWTHETFDALFAELRAWGARRVSWIDLGRAADGYFDFAPLGIAEHGQETMRQVGDIFTTAVEHAHRHGVELVGILKPFDMAIHSTSWPPFSAEAKAHGRIARIGANTGWATHLAADNQHLLMARKPSAHGPGRNAVWTRLDLVKDDDGAAAFGPGDVELLVSDDNETFHPYAGPVTRSERVEGSPVYRPTPSGPRPSGVTRRARVFRFEAMEIREPFFAIGVPGATRSFRNRLCDLAHLFGEQGEETRLTYGLSLRREVYSARTLTGPAGTPAAMPPGGLRGGFEYNRYPGSPSSALVSGGDPIDTPLALDRGTRSFLAFARGKDRGPLAALSPSFPETRALWMGWVTAMLDAGADGIDIRPGHHHSDFAWIEYGFEEPVREEMRRRTGIDIWETDEFDHELWRRIRGDGWTQFLREASAVVRARGRRLTAHIDGTFDGAPGTGGAMNMVSDWHAWIEEGLLDGVTGKALWPGTNLARDVLNLAHAHGLPVSFAPYCNNFFEKRSAANHLGDSPAGCEVPVERLIRWGRRSGYDSFLFYECASALRARSDGTIGFRRGAEPLRAVMRRHFGGA